jgi:hypothetical protein
MKTLKDFVNTIAHGIDGDYGDIKASQKTVMQRWKEFMAGFRRKYDPIPPKITLSVTNVRDIDSVQLGLH